MTLNELIEQDGLLPISQLTNISVENLKFLEEENFEKLSRVKALGFIQILEREYDLDMTDLTFHIKTYFEENKLEAGNEVVVLSKDSRDNSGFKFFNWVIILGLLYALWYFYNDGVFDKIFNKGEDKVVSLNDAEVLKSDVTEEDAKKVVVNTKSSKKSENEKRDEDEQRTRIALAELERTEVIGKERPVKKKALNLEVDLNDTQVMPIQKTVKLEEVEVQIEVPKVVTPPVLEEVNETLVREEEEKEVELIYNLTVNPTRGMLWYGFINIDTKERREFMNKVSTPFELNAGRWILVTGHGFVDIVSDLKTLEIADRKKHYFYIDSTEIKEITRREFRDMNGRRGW
jgi:hypothetical protein